MAKELMPLFGSAPAEFPTELSVEKAVERLRALLSRSTFFDALFGYRMVGKVSGRKVHLWAFGPRGPAWAPEFKGELQNRPGKVVLTGGFAIPLALRGYCFLLGGLCLVGGMSSLIALLIGSLSDNDRAALTALSIFALLMVTGVAIALGIAQRRLPAHIPWLASVIHQTLHTDEAVANQPLPAPETNDAVVVTARIMLALTCAVCLASAISGVGAIRTVKEGEQFVTHYVGYGAFPRMLVAVLGVAAAIAFLALFRRTVFVWKCALVAMPLYAVAVSAAVAGMIALMPHPDRTPAIYWANVAFFAILIGVMTAWLAVLWYTQKDNFVRRSSDTPPGDH